MKGTNDAWNMCIHNFIINGWLFRAKLVKGDNSGHYKIINFLNDKAWFSVYSFKRMHACADARWNMVI